MIHAGNCQRCPALAKTRNKIVWGEGPTPSPVIFIGEAPGKVENKLGIPFADRAPAGAEFNHMLWRRGMPRHTVYVTNLIKCHPPDDRDPTEEEITNCSYWLERDVMVCQPKFIVTLGRPATRFFLGNVDMEDVHGIPFPTEVEGLGQVTIIPCYHPAAGLHQPQTAIMVNDDLTAVVDIVRGRRPTRHVEDQHHTVDYKVEEDPAAVAFDMQVAGVTGLLGVDTESIEDGKRPWSVQYSTQPGMGRFVWAHDRECLAEIAKAVEDPHLRVGIANALYDLPILDRLGIRPATPVDTMLMAYLLQNQPQGLKPLAYRHCGMHMTDYSELTAPATHLKAMRYLAQAVEISWPEPDPVLVWDKGKPHIKQPQNIGRKIASILTAVSKYLWEEVPPDKVTQPRKRWLTIERNEGRGMVEDLLGKMPSGDLSDIPFDTALFYACRDPDAVIRIYPHLWNRVVDCDLEDTFWSDMRAMAMVSDMMICGFKGNPEAFRDLSVYLEKMYDRTVDRLLKQLAAMGINKDYFNPQSPPQVQKLIYTELGLAKHLRGVKNEGSTDDKILSRLVELRPTIGDRAADVIISIQDARGYRKIKGTYADPIPDLMDANNRVHTTFRVTRTTTGRLSSTEPNLMAQPVRSEEGRRLRDCYEAEEGCTLISCDYSQIELRVMSHDADDDRMMSIFRRGLDLHAQTASEIFGIPVSDLDDTKHRRPAKCFHPDTEVLTPKGWVAMKDLRDVSCPIIQAFQSDNAGIYLEWTRLWSLEFKPNWHPNLVRLRNEGMDLRVTPDHRMLAQKENGEFYVTTPHKLNGARYWWNCGVENEEDRRVDLRLLRLAVATQADGSYRHRRIRFGFTKQRKIDRMRLLLRHADYAERVYGKKNPTTYFILGEPLSAAVRALLDPDKTMPWWWLTLSPAFRQVVIEEAAYWDGCEREDWKAYRYTSSVAKNLDVLQAICAITNRKTRLAGNDLTVRANGRTRGGNLSVTDVEYDGDVAMLSVPSTFVLVRDGGVPVVCGQTVNFGIPYGMAAEGLQGSLATMGINWALPDCDRFIGEWFKLFPGVRRFMSNVHAHALQHNWVADMFGRRRYIPHANAKNKRLQAEALREAGNHPIQSGAQGIIKRAMGALVPVYREFRSQMILWNPLIQIHDDLVNEVADEHVDMIVGVLLHIMESVVTLKVPVKVDAKTGKKWGSLKKWKPTCNQ